MLYDISCKTRLKLSPPWITYLNKIIALFDCDPGITVSYDNSAPSVTLTINDGDKHAAIRKLLAEEVNYGGVLLKVNTEGPLSNIAFTSNKELFDAAFAGNPAYVKAVSIDNIFSTFTYVVFKNYVVQFFNDNLDDLYGNVSTLYQYIAEDLFWGANLKSVAYCTDVEHAIQNAPKQWP